MNKFYIDQRINQKEIPVLAFGVQIEELKNLNDLDLYIKSELETYLNKYSDINPREINTIIGYRKLHEKYGKKSKKIVPAPEALIKMIKNKKAIPRINPLVDIYNLISIKYALALGAHDLDKVNGNIILNFSSGGEIFVPLGSNISEEIFPNEYGYFDNATKEVLCRLEARQCDKTKITYDSKNILMIIQGNENTPADLLLSAKNELIYILNEFINISVEENYIFL